MLLYMAYWTSGVLMISLLGYESSKGSVISKNRRRKNSSSKNLLLGWFGMPILAEKQTTARFMIAILFKNSRIESLILKAPEAAQDKVKEMEK